MGGVSFLALTLTLTSCEEIFGEWDRPTPASETPTPTSRAASEATTEDIGSLIGSDGNIYAVGATLPDGVTKEAMIAYVGSASDCTHGLAIALEDSPTGSFVWAAKTGGGCDNNGKTAVQVVASWASSHAVVGGTWRLPTVDDWKYMFYGAGGVAYNVALVHQDTYNYGDFRDKITAAGGTATIEGDYLTNTETADPLKVWSYYFLSNYFHEIYKTVILGHLRAVLAF